MNQGLAAAVFVGVIAALVVVLPRIDRGLRAGTKALRRKFDSVKPAEDGHILHETVEYRTSIRPQVALRSVEAAFSAAPNRRTLPGDVRLTEKTPVCLRYSIGNRTASFLETVVAAAPWGAGSAVTFDVVRWLESDGGPTANENLRWMREDLEAVLKSADPRLEVFVRVND
ncbi:hypothetical protein [Sinomonas gamaensis]|uniref:hypothetical protein n=1 Tax=Sinomonas gamaensis TaxID=2565624 RepID=UPI001109160A|nr:hypothetical protein [Sinomonas gamaensis]